MRDRSLNEILASLPSRPKTLGGFALVAHPDSPPAGPVSSASRLLGGFVGSYGTAPLSGQRPGLTWSITPPGPEQRLTTWSCHEDENGLCQVEGDFYEPVWGRIPTKGRDERLAADLLGRVLREGVKSINELSGVYSGWIYEAATRTIRLFVDHTGSRMFYYRVLSTGILEAASSPYGFARSPEPLRLDPLGVNEHLVYGAPLDSRTVFRGVHLVPPGSAIEFRNGRTVERRYFRPPSRIEDWSARDVGEVLSGSLAKVVKACAGSDPVSLGLSSGKDCRAVLAALHHTGAAVHPLTFHEKGDVDAELAPRVAQAVGLRSQPVELDPVSGTDEAVGLSVDTALLTDGIAIGFGFMALAARAAEESPLLFTGFAGDCLSGSWSGVAPWKADSLESLSLDNWRCLGHTLDPALVFAFLRPDLRVPPDALTESWQAMYRREYEQCGDLMATHVNIRILQRNRRIGASFYHAMRSIVIPVQPYAARSVLEAYLRLPPAFLTGQRGHALASFHRCPPLGAIPTSRSRWIPLRHEHRLAGLASLKHAVRAWRRQPALAPAHPDSVPGSPSIRTRRFAEVVRHSPLFEDAGGRVPLLERMGTANDLIIHKLAALALHAEGMLSPPPLLPSFLARIPEGRP